MRCVIVVSSLFSGLLILSACAESAHQRGDDAIHLDVPPELEQQIDTGVNFADLQAAPANYVGRVVMFGGVVIRAKRAKVQTEIEVLELPTKAEGPLPKDRSKSEGRFLAVQEEFFDPAKVPPGTPVTVIGVVTGSTQRPLDEGEYNYPVVNIKHLIDWSSVASQYPGGSAASFYGPYYPPYAYWWGPYGYYPYFFGRPFFIPPRPSPPPPRPQTIPPRFRRR